MQKKFMLYYKKMGLNIAYYRKLSGYTQEALAEKLGIDQTHMSKIEVASVGISLDTLFSLSAALDIPPSRLLEFRD